MSFFRLAFLSALEQFDIIQINIFFTHFKFTNLVLFTLVFMFAIYFFFKFFSRLNYFSRRNFFKVFLYLAVVQLILENVITKKQIFIPTFFFVFIFVLTSNLAGLIPYALTVTSYFIVTSFFSWGLFLGINIIGLWTNKWETFCLFLPNGAPNEITPFFITIEIISYFARVISLAIRLFANMMAGHTLLKILTSFTLVFIKQFNFLLVIAWIPLGIVLAVTVLETLIAFLQSYVFITLVSIYLNDVINLH
jgi:ATP synthase subunit 6